MKACPIDMDLATAGYLRSPDGRLRFIHGLAAIAEEAVRAGVRFYWARTGHAGLCYCWSRVVFLDPSLTDADPWVIRDVASHELGHAVIGQSDERVWGWQRARYGDLIQPALA